jgi:hypothetical protein
MAASRDLVLEDSSGRSSLSRRARAKRRHARQQQQRLTEALVTQWIAQHGQPGSGRLERHELANLLQHLHAEAGPPDPLVLDTLITQATEVRSHTCFLRGDPNASIRHEMVISVCTGYSMYLLASVAIERRAGLEGVVALRDVPALLREAHDGSSLEAHDIDFFLDGAQSSVAGALDANSTIPREDVLTALQGMAMRYTEEAQRQFAEEQARRARIEAFERHTATGTPSTHSVRMPTLLPRPRSHRPLSHPRPGAAPLATV